MNLKQLIVWAILIVSAFNFTYAQTKSELEQRRKKLQKELQEINAVLSTSTRNEKSILFELQSTAQKIKTLEEIISLTNRQMNGLTAEINKNLQAIDRIKEDTDRLKKAYAQMALNAYKSKNQHSRLMFLLSAENFKQAIRRYEYMNQINTVRKKQAEQLVVKQQQISALNTKLIEQRKAKERLLSENQKSKQDLVVMKKAQDELLASTRKEIKNYQNQLANIEREIKSTEREIERLVREALAASNKNSSNKSSSSFTLTPEGKALARSFEQNKGKLPWPVERGYLKIGYGEHPSDLDPKLKIFSNGYRIVTAADQEARAVFRGTVFKILGANKSGRGVSVMLQHGDYFTVYSNLSAIYVKVGDAVENKQAIGKIMPSENNTAELRFSIYRNPKFIDPSGWLAKK